MQHVTEVMTIRLSLAYHYIWVPIWCTTKVMATRLLLSYHHIWFSIWCVVKRMMLQQNLTSFISIKIDYFSAGLVISIATLLLYLDFEHAVQKTNSHRWNYLFNNPRFFLLWSLFVSLQFIFSQTKLFVLSTLLLENFPIFIICGL
jgi:hypothetical protein